MFENFSIRSRLTAIVAIMFALIMVVGGVGLNGMLTSAKEADMLMDEHVRPAILLGQIRFLQAENRSQTLLALQHDAQGAFAHMHDHALEMHTDTIKKNGEKVAELLETYAKRQMDDPREIELFNKVKEARERYMLDGLRPTRELLLQGEYLQANEKILKAVNPLFRAANEAGMALENHILKAAEEEQAAHERNFKQLILLSSAMVAAGLLIVGILGVLLMRSIVRPLNGIVAHFNAMAGGDLSRQVPITGNNEITYVERGLESLQKDLVAMIGEIRRSATLMTESAGRLQGEMSAVAHNSAEQQDGGTQVAAAMEQMTASVSEVAASTEHASDAARTSANLAQEGSRQAEHTMAVTREVVSVMDSSSEIMRELQNSVVKIGAVTNVIREVADQTNLLALNAAIEAARAGEQGRGFAVVADEVRKLAERTTTSTADIARIVGEVRSSAEHAVSSMSDAQTKIVMVQKSASESNTSLAKTLQAAEAVSGLAEKIAQASEEQTVSADSVAKSMERIASLISDTHDRIRGVTTESESLTASADHMQDLVSKFRV